jgi:hypothetical protein
MTTFEDTQSRMLTLAKSQPLQTLCDALLTLDGKDKLTEAERMTRMTLIDAVCAKSPAADAAFERWADSDDDPRSAVEVIVAAVRNRKA